MSQKMPKYCQRSFLTTPFWTKIPGFHENTFPLIILPFGRRLVFLMMTESHGGGLEFSMTNFLLRGSSFSTYFVPQEKEVFE